MRTWLTAIRTLWPLALLVALAGCSISRCLQHERDINLLLQTDAYACEHACNCDAELTLPQSALPPSDCLAHRLAEQEQPVEHAFSLFDAIRIRMHSSAVVRVLDGTDLAASEDTFFDIQANQEEIAKALAAFDTTFESVFTGNAFKRPPDAFFGPGLVQPQERDEASLNFGWARRTELGGETAFKYNPNPGYLFIPDQSSGFNPRHIGELELTVKQPLLKGAGKRVNLAPIEVARINAEQSDWDFKRALMSSVQGAVAAYWDLYAADVAVEVVEDVLPLLEEVVRIQKEAFKTQWVTETEVAKAEAQLYEFRQKRQALLSQRFEAELRLRNLIGLSPQDGRKLIASTKPLDRPLVFDAEESLLAALDNQPDIVTQRLKVRLRSINHRLAINGRQLQLDVFAIVRRNGIAEDLGTAVTQMLTEDFTDWQFGAELTVPLGRRQAEAEVRATERRLTRERQLLDQQVLTIQHNIQNTLRAIEFAYREYEQSVKRVEAAEKWAAGAKLRYQNPNVVTGGSNVLVTNLNEYLNSLRFRIEAATERAALLAAYNAQIVQLEEQKGTLLAFFDINLRGDPCSVSDALGDVGLFAGSSATEEVQEQEKESRPAARPPGNTADPLPAPPNRLPPPDEEADEGAAEPEKTFTPLGLPPELGTQ